MKEPSVEDLMEDSVSLVDELFANAPTVPPRPSLAPEEPVEPAVVPAEVTPAESTVATEPVVPTVDRVESHVPAQQVKKRKSSMPIRQGFQFLIVPIKPNQIRLERLLSHNQKLTDVAKETPAQEPVASVDTRNDLPRRSRTESVKPTKEKEKITLERTFRNTLCFLAFTRCRWFLWLPIC